MGHVMAPLPHWTREDVELALDALGPTARHHPSHEHLTRGLRMDAATTSPPDGLKVLPCTAVPPSRMGVSGTGLLREDRSFG